MGRAFPKAAVDRALRDEADHAARINRVFDHFDVLMTPVSTRPPVGAQEWEGKSAFRTVNEMGRVYPYTGVWNATGQPAASVPAGFTSDGLPLAVQLVGRPGDEHTLLSLAAQIEAERPWADAPPTGLTHRARDPHPRHALGRAAATGAARARQGRHLRMRPHGLRARARGQRPPVRGLRAAQALPRARGAGGHIGRERHRRERQDLRRGERGRDLERGRWPPR